MIVLAKFTVSKVAELGRWNGGRQEIQKISENGNDYVSTGFPVREITLSAVYDDGIDKENKSFAKATPTGNITFFLNNVALADEFKPGDTYYVQFTRKE